MAVNPDYDEKEGFDEIDTLFNEQNANLDQQRALQQQIIDKGLQKQENLVQREKQEYDEEADKNARALYSNYQKQVNPYGENAEKLATSNLRKSGYAETVESSLYNTYQKNVTSLVNETNKLKAQADFNLNQAYVDADIQRASNEVALFQQKATLALQEYDLKMNRRQFNYQKERDRIADEQWEKSYQLQLRQQEASEQQWEKQYQLSLQNYS